jgi:hypothetical protein
MDKNEMTAIIVRYEESLKGLYSVANELQEIAKKDAVKGVVSDRLAWFVEMANIDFSLAMNRPEYILGKMMESWNWRQEYWDYLDKEFARRAETERLLKEVENRHGVNSKKAKDLRKELEDFEAYANGREWENDVNLVEAAERGEAVDERVLRDVKKRLRIG